ncbi:MAG TPA: T9SS type A sorting domain-containing protein, partial [Flavipsychrobacter sp.]
FQYTFNVVTDPAGANVIWNFGDGSPTVGSTAGTPVNHTYAGPGTYTVCVQQLNSAGQVCDEECIDICIADNGGAQKPGRTQAQSSTLDISGKNSNLAVGNLYPNPTDGTLNIPVTAQTGEEVTVRIIRMDGVVMYDAKETLEQGKQTLKVNLGNLTPGNYMCEIRDNKTRNTRMFTKQ